MLKVSSDVTDLLKQMGSSLPVISINPDMIKLQLGKNGGNFEVSDSVLFQICAAINSGKNIILSGPPGTGKTTLAEAICYVVNNKEPIITTATSDWTTFDTVGGYMPEVNNPNQLNFEPGLLLQSIIERNWIVVDEINRSQIDKAIGQFFSVLSGNDVLLTYRSSITQNRISIKSDNKPNTEDTFYKTSNWRMIATMNEVDKTTLFDMSDAFMRRFSIIRVGLPEDYPQIVSNWSTDLEDEIVENLMLIALNSTTHEIKEIGPAIMLDVISYLKERKQFDNNFILHYSEALSMYVIPQFQSADDEEVQAILSIVKNVLSKDRKAVDHINLAVKTIINCNEKVEFQGSP